MIRTVLITALLMLMCGCRTHKQTQATSQTEASGRTTMQDSATSVRVTHAAADIRTLLTHQADSVVATIEADSVVTPDGTRICNARMRATLHRPSAAMVRTEQSAVADSASSAAGSSVTATHRSSEVAAMQQTAKPKGVFSQTDIIFLCCLIVAAMTIIGILVYKTRRLR